MKLNPLVWQVAVDQHTSSFCKVCGSLVSTYNANDAALIAERPEAATCDWWVACDDADCEHAYGEAALQGTPDWVEER